MNKRHNRKYIINDELLEEVVSHSPAYTVVAMELFGTDSSGAVKAIRRRVKELKLNVSHFNKNYKHSLRTKPRVSRLCPGCNIKFSVLASSNQKACSTSCSYKSRETSDYRDICFRNHGKSCIVCGEDNVVDAHHYDGDRGNNSTNNLIPLCPTHHAYLHRGFGYLIKDNIDNFIKVLDKLI